MKPKLPDSWNVNPDQTKTSYANSRSRMAHQQLGDGNNAVVFVPGKAQDQGFVDTAFASLNGSPLPDFDQPLAKFYRSEWR